MKVAVIGSGVSGIAAAHALEKAGHEAAVFEKSEQIGGVWALAYPEVRLQNSSTQYHFSDFPWPFAPAAHPTGDDIRRYLALAVEHFRLDLRLGHEVVKLEERPGGWCVHYCSREGSATGFFDYVIVAIGQYSDGKHRPQIPGEEQFKGRIMTERDLRHPDEFAGGTVAVVGFGKSAVDMARLAAGRARQVQHVFRTARWLIPNRLFGIDVNQIIFNRASTAMMSSWVHPTAVERFLHEKCPRLVRAYWTLIRWLYRAHNHLHPLHLNGAARARLAAYLPQHEILPDMRSAAAQQPPGFFKCVKKGQIQPFHAELAAFTPRGLRLGDGREVAADIVVLSLGSESPRMAFMPGEHRQMLESEGDGPQLYRHMIHPRIPRLAFAGFNHGFMHIPAVEVGMFWLAALINGDMALPPREEMEASMARVRLWKRQHIAFEPSRACAVNTRFQQYIDTLLQDLRINPYRKLPNIFAELFGVYGAADYVGLEQEYRRPELPYSPILADT